MTPYHAGLRDDQVHWYIKLIPGHPADELHVERQAGGSEVWRQVLDDSVKVSAPPTQPIAFTVPDDAWHKNNVNGIKAHRMNVLRLRL